MAEATAELMPGDLTTINDVLAVRTDLTSEVVAIRAEMLETELRPEAKIGATKANLIKWVVGMITLQAIVPLGAAVALPRAVAR